MPGLGTIINVAAIVGGGLLGVRFGKLLSESLQDSFIKVSGVSTLFIAISGAIEQMMKVSSSGTLSSSGSMMMMLSLILGTLIGELLRLEDKLEKFGEWLKKKTGNARDKEFVNAFVTASLTVCIGAMAVVGSIEDGISGDHSILFAKSVLDFTIVIIFGASLGKGAVFSGISVGIFQGAITVLARFLSPVMTSHALSNLSLVGNVMIFCVGVNLIWGKKFRVANMLPGLLLAVIFAYMPV